MIIITHVPGAITVCGHALYDEPGKDIVCAAVSVLVQNLIVSTYKLAGYEMAVTEKDGYISSIKYRDIRNMTEVERTLINSFFIGIEMIAESYPENVKLNN